MARVIDKRVTAEIDGAFVVFLIGMRVNKFWKAWKWPPIFFAMPRMLRELEQKPEAGFLGASGYFGSRLGRFQLNDHGPYNPLNPSLVARSALRLLLSPESRSVSVHATSRNGRQRCVGADDGWFVLERNRPPLRLRVVAAGLGSAGRWIRRFRHAPAGHPAWMGHADGKTTEV